MSISSLQAAFLLVRICALRDLFTQRPSTGLVRLHEVHVKARGSEVWPIKID
jgi:hypothetical protein